MSETHQSDSTDLDSDDDLVELPRLAKHVNHEIFDPTYTTECSGQIASRDSGQNNIGDNIVNLRSSEKLNYIEKQTIVEGFDKNDNISKLVKYKITESSNDEEYKEHIEGVMQHCCNSFIKMKELQQCCITPPYSESCGETTNSRTYNEHNYQENITTVQDLDINNNIVSDVKNEILDSKYDIENARQTECYDSRGNDQVSIDKNRQERSNFDKKQKTNRRSFNKNKRSRLTEELLDENNNETNLLKTLKCDFCQRLFRYKNEIRGHMITHGIFNSSVPKGHAARCEPKQDDIEKVVPCDKCSQYFPTDIEVMVHKQDYHGVCSVCNITLPSCDTLQQHLDTHTNPTLQRCLICGSGFMARVALLYHIKYKHADACDEQAVYDTLQESDKKLPDSGVNVFYFKCPYCQNMFSQKQQCLDHMSHHKTELKCKHCSKEFDQRKYLLRHLLKHSQNRKVQCYVCMNHITKKRIPRHSLCDKRILCCRRCGVTEANTHDLTEHMSKHFIKTDFKCDQCNKTFQYLSAVNKHKKQHHESNIFKCNLCEVVCKDEAILLKHTEDKHSQKDESVKPSCQICQKSFESKKLVSKHMMVHRPKTIQCNYCPKMFHYKWMQRTHEVQHTGEGKYRCETCNKAFSQPCNLKRHQLVHNSIRAFKCSECEKSFQTHSHLRYHMFTHTGERPYVCDICGQGFTNQTHRKTHMRTHTGETPYLCQHCGAAYPTNAQLQRHILKHQ